MKLFYFIFTRLLIICLGLYLFYFSYLYINQVDMVFNRSKLPKDYQFSFNQEFEEFNFMINLRYYQ